MARPKKYKKQQVRDALTQAHGLMTGAAELLGSSFETVQRYMANDPDAQAIVDHWRKRRKDRAEYKLDEAIERGESWAIMFTLKNAKDREYSDRIDFTSGEKPIEFDYAKFISAATRSNGNNPAPGQDEGSVHGEALGQDSNGGSSSG